MTAGVRSKTIERRAAPKAAVMQGSAANPVGAPRPSHPRQSGFLWTSCVERISKAQEVKDVANARASAQVAVARIRIV